MAALEARGEGGRMKVCALLFHDVVRDDHFEASGFQSADANIYKLDVAEFGRHLDSVARQSSAALTYVDTPSPTDVVHVLTFDDGGASAMETADLLEARGWRGYFFITTSRIGTPGFVSADQLRALHARGHVVGSHSVNHPPRMSTLTPAALYTEWRDSIATLTDILGDAVDVASVPGGYYAPHVAQAAARAGIRTLFNSEPVMGVHQVDGCRVIGRFGVQQGVAPEWTAAIVRGDVRPRLERYAIWNAKKIAKRLGGAYWLAFRRRFIAARASRAQS